MSRPSLESMLDPGETIVFRTGVHPSVLMIPLISAFPPLAYALQVRAHPGTLWLAIGCTVVSAVISFFTVLDFVRTEYAVTDRRVLRRGAFGPSVTIPIGPALSVTRLHGAARDTFNRGTLRLVIAGQQRIFPAVRQAEAFMAAIDAARFSRKDPAHRSAEELLAAKASSRTTPLQ